MAPFLSVSRPPHVSGADRQIPRAPARRPVSTGSDSWDRLPSERRRSAYSPIADRLTWTGPGAVPLQSPSVLNLKPASCRPRAPALHRAGGTRNRAAPPRLFQDRAGRAETAARPPRPRYITGPQRRGRRPVTRWPRLTSEAGRRRQASVTLPVSRYWTAEFLERAAPQQCHTAPRALCPPPCHCRRRDFHPGSPQTDRKTPKELSTAADLQLFGVPKPLSVESSMQHVISRYRLPLHVFCIRRCSSAACERSQHVGTKCYRGD